ncbi:MAG: TIM barrel protein [Alistipes sp.]|nr:TIM barrel protein [Alistipes sp.]
MDRLSFFKQGLSSVMEAATSLVGIKKAADSFTEAVADALSEVRSNIGLHLATLDNEMYNCVETTLEKVAELGYTSIEVGAFYRGKVYLLPPAEFKALARRVGLKITSAYLKKEPTMTLEQRAEFYAQAANEGASEGVGNVAGQAADNGTSQAANEEANEGTSKAAESSADSASKPQPKDPDTEWWETAIATYAQLGCKYLTLAYQPEGNDEKAIENFVAYIKLIGEIASKHNLKLCYHPNCVALMPSEGVSALDKVASQCDAETLLFEIDTFEAYQAGIKAEELIKQYGQRIAALHLHDMENVCDSGNIDFDAVLKQASKSGIDNIYIEVHRFIQPPINCVERSLISVETLPNAKF